MEPKDRVYNMAMAQWNRENFLCIFFTKYLINEVCIPPTQVGSITLKLCNLDQFGLLGARFSCYNGVGASYHKEI